MFGCIGRLVVLAVLIIVGAAAYLTRGMREPTLRAKLGARPAATAAAPAWDPITPAGAARARAALATMQRPAGPVFVNVKAGDLLAFALDSAFHRWGPATPSTPSTPGAPGATGAEALAGENAVSVRGTIHMKDLGAAAALGPLAGILEGDQPIEVRGRLEVLGKGRVLFHVERIALRNFVLPSAAIGAVVQRIAPRTDASVPSDAFVMVLPAEIADIRVTPGRVTLYKAVK